MSLNYINIYTHTPNSRVHSCVQYNEKKHADIDNTSSAYHIFITPISPLSIIIKHHCHEQHMLQVHEGSMQSHAASVSFIHSFSYRVPGNIIHTMYNLCGVVWAPR